MMSADLPNDPFASLLGYQLRRASLMMMTDLSAALEPLGLRPAESSVLFAIGANPGITQSEVGRMLGIKRANMAPLIAGLEARAVVSRAAVDGRSQALRLTELGESLRIQAGAAHAEHEQRCFGGLSNETRQKLTADLHALWWRPDGGE